MPQQRNSKNSPYYQFVEDHFEAFEQMYEERFERRYGFFRPYVKEVIYQSKDGRHTKEFDFGSQMMPIYNLCFRLIRLEKSDFLLFITYHSNCTPVCLSGPFVSTPSLYQYPLNSSPRIAGYLPLALTFDLFKDYIWAYPTGGG
jgi:hypothetical protein